jgi:hypothetical protein
VRRLRATKEILYSERRKRGRILRIKKEVMGKHREKSEVVLYSSGLPGEGSWTHRQPWR